MSQLKQQPIVSLLCLSVNAKRQPILMFRQRQRDRGNPARSVISLAAPRAFNRRYGVDAMTWMHSAQPCGAAPRSEGRFLHFPATISRQLCGFALRKTPPCGRRAELPQRRDMGAGGRIHRGGERAQERAVRAGEGVGRWGDSDKMTQIVCIGPATGNGRRASPRREKS